jgi:hypothetical protein
MSKWRDPEDRDYKLPRGRAKKSKAATKSDSLYSIKSLVVSKPLGAAVALLLFLAANVLSYIAGGLSWQQKAKDNDWIPRDNWKQVALDNNWIPGTESDSDWQQVSSSGKDSAGRSVQVIVNILSQEYRWSFGRADEVELGGHKEDLRLYISRLNISNSKGIVCVGAASVEGRRAEQESLALSRAENLVSLVREESRTTTPLYILNLGQFKTSQSLRTSPEETSSQRRVIIIKIVAQEDNINLQEAMYNALISANRSNLPIVIDVSDYSTFKLYPVRN